MSVYRIKIIFIYLITISSFLHSQITGTKFAPDSTYWKENGSWISSGGPGNFTYAYGYSNKFIKGDSVIGNNYYQKMYLTNRSNFDTICLGTPNLIHYNNKKLYLNNKLIYDFNLILGDTINIYYNWTPNHPAGYYTYTVTTCDSVNIGNKWRKRLNLTRPPNTFVVNNIKWVEGIGDINYGFNSSYYALEMILSIGYWKLNCFSEHFQNTYGSGCGVSSYCSIVNQTSKMACNSVSSNINFNIYAGVAPYTFTIQPPALCTTVYTAVSTSTATTFSLSCAGVYTINLRDANNSNLGIVTHTVSLDTLINVSVNAPQDTICDTQSITLSIIPSGSNYTISPINWSNGGTNASITVSPNVTTTYSVTGLYTTANTRTCTAKGSKKINVKSCVGIEELNLMNQITIYPNPAKDKLFILNNSGSLVLEVNLLTIEGKKIKSVSKNETINLMNVQEGLYYLEIQTNKGKIAKKIIVQKN